MINRFFAALIALTLLAGTVFTVSAQNDATPEARAESGTGDEIVVVDQDGDDLARFTISEIQDPFKDYEDFSAPERGTRYLAVMMTIENLGERDLDFNTFDLILRDEDGFIYGTAFVSLPDGGPAELESESLATGDSLEGIVIFSLLNDAAPSDLFYAPSERLVTLHEFDESAS